MYNKTLKERILSMKSKLQTGLARLRSKFMDALPIILFFLYLFYSVILIFGISHVILVSVVTILFKMNYRRYMTARQLMGLAGTQLLMALLSFLATLNLPLCIILNLTVPFLLVFLQSSQFNQLGYYTGVFYVPAAAPGGMAGPGRADDGAGLRAGRHDRGSVCLFKKGKERG